MKYDLNEFITTNSNQASIEYNQMDPVARFIHNQIIELAKSCLDKSERNELTCAYFDEITNSLEKLLAEARDKCVHAEMSVQFLRKFVEKFLFIVVRTARLLECLEFDPLEFFHLLDEAEASTDKDLIKTSLPKYIISKLGLNRDTMEEFVHASNETSRICDDKVAVKKWTDSPTESDFVQIKLISNGAYG